MAYKTGRRSRVHVVELAPLGFRYYKGAFDSFEDAPPRYTWRRVDYRVNDTVVYVDMQCPDPVDFAPIF